MPYEDIGRGGKGRCSGGTGTGTVLRAVKAAGSRSVPSRAGYTTAAAVTLQVSPVFSSPGEIWPCPEGFLPLGFYFTLSLGRQE